MERKINLVLKKEQSKYEQIRRRVTNHYNNKNMSDKEIIESLAEEIKQYRNRIECQNEIIDKLSKRTIQSEEVMLDTTNELIDKDVTDIISITAYADGKPIKTTMEYKYKKANPDTDEDWTRYEESN